MKEKLLKALYSSDKTPLVIGGIEIPCYVLEGGIRVFSGRGMQSALGFSKNASGLALTKFLAQHDIQPLLSEELKNKLKNRIKFTRRGAGGANTTTYGYEATLLIDLCNLFMDLRNANKLTPKQLLLAERAEIIIRAVAKIGIIALVDEATGYQEVRAKEALQALLDKYLRKELALWAKRFPDEFYKQMFRLKGWDWRNMTFKRPSVVGRYTNDLVYARIAPGLLEELKKKEPKNDKGRRKNKFHQWLSDDIGIPDLNQHLFAIIGFMRASANWDEFYRLIQRAFPIQSDQLLLNFEE